MSDYRVTLEAKLLVKFTNPETAEKIFIDGDWKETFYTLYDLEDLVRHLSYAFMRTPDEWNSELKLFVKFIEGFDLFVLRGETYSSIYCVDGEPYEITIEQEQELEVDWVDEI